MNTCFKVNKGTLYFEQINVQIVFSCIKLWMCVIVHSEITFHNF